MRYTRHLRLPGFGEVAQQRVENARVLVVGAGGLGSPVLLYLTAAGVGTIGIVDNDVVDESNLQRQVIHSSVKEGMRKTTSAAQVMNDLNPHTGTELHSVKLTTDNAQQIVGSYDLVIDCSDNFQTRYLVNDVCEELGLPHVWGAVISYYGQVSVFMHDGSVDSVTLDDVYPRSEKYDALPTPQEKGTFGPICGVIGSYMASEALKIIGGMGTKTYGKIALIDVLNGEMRTVPVATTRA
ncbi:HesA/MoeB/ThiF family protein [Arcanobacterium phocisimile]|uniref:HesA/MoeB/ThiF family protein n=1 Tax=Arcanobacterium phocisimile TaxID=1302235 RepID=A0ABX7IEZ3_9ACTO|nr:HesA/MoeB/ThiF family protein [Arcanobacterium phocisimile]QRV01706.1 HesA/MoeB/ThiF family protein [Arcanobacterium phocisimile]